MEFGAHLPTYLPTYWKDYETGNVGTAVEEAAQAAEVLGYASIWANDVVLAPRSVGVQAVEPLITLASLIHRVPRIKLGTSVLVLPQRNAILVAKQVAALDLLSGSRLLFGVGVGWREAEFKYLGADFEHRGAVADEAIEVMRCLWRDPVGSFHGQFYNFDDALFLPKPPNGGPPIWVGGPSAAAIRRAARLGHAWLPWAPGLDEFTAGVALLRELSRERPCPMIAAEMIFRVDPPGRPAGPAMSDAVPIGCAGSPEAIAQYIEQYRQVGLEYVICAFVSEGVDDLLRQMRVFAEQVAPQFRGRSVPSQSPSP